MDINSAIGKTKEAIEALKKIGVQLLKKFFEQDLEKLRKKTTPKAVIEYVE